MDTLLQDELPSTPPPSNGSISKPYPPSPLLKHRMAELRQSGTCLDALSSLNQIVRNMQPCALPRFLTHLQSESSSPPRKPSYAHHAISLYISLAREHKQKLIPQIPRVMKNLMLHLKQGGAGIVSSPGGGRVENSVHGACAQVVLELARIPVEEKEAGVQLLQMICSPLIGALSKGESESCGAAYCLKALVDADDVWKRAGNSLVDDACSETAEVLRLDTAPIFLQLACSLARSNISVCQHYAPDLLQAAGQAIQWGAASWQQRCEAAKLYIELLSRADADVAVALAPAAMDVLEGVRKSDPSPYVCMQVVDAINALEARSPDSLRSLRGPRTPDTSPPRRTPRTSPPPQKRAKSPPLSKSAPPNRPFSSAESPKLRPKRSKMERTTDDVTAGSGDVAPKNQDVAAVHDDVTSGRPGKRSVAVLASVEWPSGEGGGAFGGSPIIELPEDDDDSTPLLLRSRAPGVTSPRLREVKDQAQGLKALTEDSGSAGSDWRRNAKLMQSADWPIGGSLFSGSPVYDPDEFDLIPRSYEDRLGTFRAPFRPAIQLGRTPVKQSPISAVQQEPMESPEREVTSGFLVDRTPVGANRAVDGDCELEGGHMAGEIAEAPSLKSVDSENGNRAENVPAPVAESKIPRPPVTRRLEAFEAKEKAMEESESLSEARPFLTVEAIPPPSPTSPDRLTPLVRSPSRIPTPSTTPRPKASVVGSHIPAPPSLSKTQGPSSPSPTDLKPEALLRPKLDLAEKKSKGEESGVKNSEELERETKMDEGVNQERETVKERAAKWEKLERETVMVGARKQEKLERGGKGLEDVRRRNGQYEKLEQAGKKREVLERGGRKREELERAGEKRVLNRESFEERLRQVADDKTSDGGVAKRSQPLNGLSTEELKARREKIGGVKCQAVKRRNSSLGPSDFLTTSPRQIIRRLAADSPPSAKHSPATTPTSVLAPQAPGGRLPSSGLAQHSSSYTPPETPGAETGAGTNRQGLHTLRDSLVGNKCLENGHREGEAGNTFEGGLTPAVVVSSGNTLAEDMEIDEDSVSMESPAMGMSSGSGKTERRESVSSDVMTTSSRRWSATGSVNGGAASRYSFGEDSGSDTETQGPRSTVDVEKARGEVTSEAPKDRAGGKGHVETFEAQKAARAKVNGAKNVFGDEGVVNRSCGGPEVFIASDSVKSESPVLLSEPALIETPKAGSKKGAEFLQEGSENTGVTQISEPGSNKSLKSFVDYSEDVRVEPRESNTWHVHENPIAAPGAGRESLSPAWEPSESTLDRAMLRRMSAGEEVSSPAPPEVFRVWDNPDGLAADDGIVPESPEGASVQDDLDCSPPSDGNPREGLEDSTVESACGREVLHRSAEESLRAENRDSLSAEGLGFGGNEDAKDDALEQNGFPGFVVKQTSAGLGNLEGGLSQAAQNLSESDAPETNRKATCSADGADEPVGSGAVKTASALEAKEEAGRNTSQSGEDERDVNVGGRIEATAGGEGDVTAALEEEESRTKKERAGVSADVSCVGSPSSDVSFFVEDGKSTFSDAPAEATSMSSHAECGVQGVAPAVEKAQAVGNVDGLLKEISADGIVPGVTSSGENTTAPGVANDTGVSPSKSKKRVTFSMHNQYQMIEPNPPRGVSPGVEKAVVGTKPSWWDWVGVFGRAAEKGARNAVIAIAAVEVGTVAWVVTRGLWEAYCAPTFNVPLPS